MPPARRSLSQNLQLPFSSWGHPESLTMQLFYPLVFFCFHFKKTSATCYYPNGTTVPVDSYQPCNPNDTDSMCCRLNGGDPDKCRSDGLCLSSFDSNIWRESCTDHSWKSPNCIKLCPNGIGKRLSSPWEFSSLEWRAMGTKGIT